jgi:hypothetical protein
MAPRRRREDELSHELAGVAPLLDAVPAPEPSAELVARTLALARAELAAAAAPVPEASWRVRPSLPVGFAGELMRLLGLAAAPLALAIAWNVAVIALAWPLLQALLPEALAVGVVVSYAFGALGWLALATASLPFAAHRLALARRPEVVA